MSAADRRIILDKDGVGRALAEMADQIVGSGPDPDSLVLVGVRTGGAHLARRMQGLLKERLGRELPCGIIDINLYRDDWTRAHVRPVVGRTELNFSIEDAHIILVDDVLYTGRTVRAALDALMDYGRPARIELAVLVDRGRRELPIAATYTGLAVEAAREERVNVHLAELSDVDEVAVEANAA